MLCVATMALAEAISLVSLSEKSPFRGSRRLIFPLTRGWNDRIMYYV